MAKGSTDEEVSVEPFLMIQMEFQIQMELIIKWFNDLYLCEIFGKMTYYE